MIIFKFGKSTISMCHIYNRFVTNYQRVSQPLGFRTLKTGCWCIFSQCICFNLQAYIVDLGRWPFSIDLGRCSAFSSTNYLAIQKDRDAEHCKKRVDELTTGTAFIPNLYVWIRPRPARQHWRYFGGKINGCQGGCQDHVFVDGSPFFSHLNLVIKRGWQWKMRKCPMNIYTRRFKAGKIIELNVELSSPPCLRTPERTNEVSCYSRNRLVVTRSRTKFGTWRSMNYQVRHPNDSQVDL